MGFAYGQCGDTSSDREDVVDVKLSRFAVIVVLKVNRRSVERRPRWQLGGLEELLVLGRGHCSSSRLRGRRKGSNGCGTGFGNPSLVKDGRVPGLECLTVNIVGRIRCFLRRYVVVFENWW